MSAARLPPALEVFPTLAKFPALNPRRLHQIPIGCRGGEDASLADLRRSALHIYHDLGVLVFAGCSAAQVHRIGDVLRQVVTWGGPGGIVSMLHDRTVKFYKATEAADAVGILKLEAVMRLAKARIKEQLKERVEGMRPAVKGIHTRDIEIVVPGGPQPSGIVHQTLSGPRRLPVESWTALSINNKTGHLVGEIRFFTAGAGEYLGGATIKYLMFRRDSDDEPSAPFWAHGRIPERMRREPQLVRERMDKVLDRALQPLWEMERDVWGNRADELARSRAREKERKEWERMRM
ncbi:hypothetical protein ESCO_001658 [Escovopsis weberi]|uniref:Uncharacterized protein n=1 Tax=Escovopsis weberi TaxID=150374 RepID=A0A0M8N840_ESCWE|nr:hypothetical protein ESCO_001658 [Escovopsis weberi]